VSDSGLFKSTDGGTTWGATGLLGKNTNVSAVAIDPLTPGALYAGINGYSSSSVFRRLLKSTDGGGSWFAADHGLANLINTSPIINSLVINRAILYAATSGSGVFRSEDGGASWTEFSTGLTNQTVEALVTDTRGDQLYAATGAGVFSCQLGESCPGRISRAAQFFSSTGGSGTVDVSVGGQCSWTVSEDVDSLTITSSLSGIGNGTVTFEVTENLESSARIASFVIAGRKFTAVQDGRLSAACVYSISSQFQKFSAAGSSGVVEVSTDNHCPWHATSNADWLIITSLPVGIGNTRVTYVVAANPTNASRKAAITIGDQTFSVKQKKNLAN